MIKGERSWVSDIIKSLSADDLFQKARKILLSNSADLLTASRFSLLEPPPIMRTSVQPLVAECADISVISSIRKSLGIKPAEIVMGGSIKANQLPPEMKLFFTNGIPRPLSSEKIGVRISDRGRSYSFSTRFPTENGTVVRSVDFIYSDSSQPVLQNLVINESSEAHHSVSDGNTLTDVAQRKVTLRRYKSEGRHIDVAILDQKTLKRCLGVTNEGRLPTQKVEVKYVYKNGESQLTKAMLSHSLHESDELQSVTLPTSESDPTLSMFFPPDTQLAQMIK